MPRRIYPLRVLGMGLGGMVVGVVLWERNASAAAWLGMLLACFGWPHVALWRTRRSRNPYRTEAQNLLIDSALTSALVPLMHFNLLPSVLVLTLTMVDKITTGIRGLWLRSLPAMLLGGGLGALLAGLHWSPHTSMTALIACLPVMSLHTLSVSVVSYQLIRKTAEQNQLLQELRRLDAMTGLFERGHWQEQAEATLRRHHATDEPACMLLLDIDRFKEINDAYGHTVGDEVIRALAHVVRGNVRSGDCAGRYGGDEFAIILPGMQARDALAIAQRIREQTEGVRLRHQPELRITSSIGVAPADHRYSSLRVWIDAADRALYLAKREGRNRVARSAEPELEPAV